MEPSRRFFFISLGVADFVTYDQREVFFPTLFCQANVIIQPGFHMIVSIVPIVQVVSKNVQTIGTIIWKPDL